MKIRNVRTAFQRRTEKGKKERKSLFEKLVFTASNKDAENVALCLCAVPTLVLVK